MPKRSLPVLLILALLLTACASLSPQTVDIIPEQPSSPVATSTDSPPVPEATSIPTQTPTPLYDEVVVLTNEPLNIVLTSVHLQLDENQVRLTEAANQIATLSAENYLLETQVAAARTQAASAGEEGNDSSSGGTDDKEYDIPANVYQIVTTANTAYIWVVGSYNKNGAPIMTFYEPRVSFPPGTRGWANKNAVKADGGALYYEVYDPDGQTTGDKYYYQGRQIQVRLPNGSPNPAKYPDDVAKAKVLERVAVYEIVRYNDKGAPILATYKPYIHYDAGDTLILYPKFIVADGGSHWYPIYDSDGKPSGYLPATKVSFLYLWD